jgi:DHA2 family multidrug resistance protein
MSNVSLSSFSASPTSTKPSERIIVALVGILLAAMMTGFNNRVGALALADLRGACGFGFDLGSWINTAYAAGELVAMPFASWFAITLSIRRFHLWMLGVSAALAAILPFVQNLDLLLGLRFVQGVAAGSLIPILMMAALKFLPPSIRLHGLALYALTATFAPNLSIWLAGQWTDRFFNWRWIYWQIIPLAVLASLLVGWGLPREPIQAQRFRHANWVGMACGIPGLCLITVALTQGVRLDWFNSSLIKLSLGIGLMLIVIYLVTEWYHPEPFIKLDFLSRRNLGLGFPIFVCLLVVLLSGAILPSVYLGSVQNYRPFQSASVGLIVALPQLIMGSVVALFLYQKWVDSRIVFALGLILIALACFSGSNLTSNWNRDQFVLPQILQAVGQPMAVVSILFLLTSVVHPSEGAYVSGMVNTLRVLGTLIGSAIVEQFLIVRGRFHTEMLLDHAALVGNSLPIPPEPTSLMGAISSQVQVLATADAYRALGTFAIILIPLVLLLTYIPAPNPHMDVVQALPFEEVKPL